MPKIAKFLWTDNEMELGLLSVTHEYKVKKNSQGVDWESVRSKYEDILELFKDALPLTPDDPEVKGYRDDAEAKD